MAEKLVIMVRLGGPPLGRGHLVALIDGSVLFCPLTFTQDKEV